MSYIFGYIISSTDQERGELVGFGVSAFYVLFF
jgi:hypothetical protein